MTEKPFVALKAAKITIGLFAALLSLAIWAAVLVQMNAERQDAVAAAIRANESRVAAFEQYVMRTLERAEAALTELEELAQATTGTPARPQRLEQASLKGGVVQGASIVDANGYVIAGDMAIEPYFNVAQRHAFAIHRTRQPYRAYVSRPRPAPSRNVAVINITRRLSGPDGSFRGVAAVSILPGTLIDFYPARDAVPRDLISVIGEDGITRARRTGSRISYGEDLNGRLVMDFHRRNPNGTYLGPSALDGIWRYFSHRTLTDYPIFVTAGVGRDDVLAPLEERHRYYVAGAITLTLLILAFALLSINFLQRRQSATRALDDAIARLRQAQRIASIGDWEYDLGSRRMIWSEQLFAMYGRDLKDGAPDLPELLSYMDDQGRAATKRAQRTAARTGEPQQHELTVYLRDGSVRHHEMLVVPTRDGTGRVARLHGTAQDVSARKLVEELQARLSHLSRIDAMNAMAATLAHELNQPLTAAANYLAGTRRLANRLEDEASEPIKDGLAGAEKQLLQAGNIIRRVRDMIADRSPKSEQVRLPDVVSDALTLIRMSRSYPDIKVKLDIAADAETVIADAVQLQQVLVNLVRNGCDAMAGAAHAELRIAARRQGEQVRVCIADRGTGIPASVGDLFSTFSTSKKDGLGIGLSISRTIIEAHGGQIWVEDTGPDGTTICFTIAAPAG